jgi:hypothetical protein
MNFKINFASSFLGSDQATAESFEDKRDNALRKHDTQLTPTQRVAAVMLMSELFRLDQLLDDQVLGDKVLLTDTRYTFKYFAAAYITAEAEAEPRVKQAFVLHESIARMATELLTGKLGPIAHTLHTFGYKIVSGELGQNSMIVGRNFRIVFG